MRHVPAFMACCLFIGAWVAAFTIQPEPSFTLLAIDYQGEVFEVDGGLTRSDCLEQAPLWMGEGSPYESMVCEAEA